MGRTQRRRLPADSAPLHFPLLPEFATLQAFSPQSDGGAGLQAHCAGSSSRGLGTTHEGPSRLQGPRRVQQGSPARRPRPVQRGAGTSSHRDSPGAEPGWRRRGGSGARRRPQLVSQGREGGAGRHVAPLEAREGGQSIVLRPRVGSRSGGGPRARRIGVALGSRAPGPRPSRRVSLRPASPPPPPGAGRCSCCREIRPEIRTGEARRLLVCLIHRMNCKTKKIDDLALRFVLE